MAICEKTTTIMSRKPYSDSIIIVEPILEVKEDLDFDCS
jgi:hypothetical protein